jgi:hypothetical protein
MNGIEQVMPGDQLKNIGMLKPKTMSFFSLAPSFSSD